MPLGGADKDNYSLSAATATDTADITAKAVSVTGLVAANKVYDGNATATISSYGALAGVVSGDVVTLNTKRCISHFRRQGRWQWEDGYDHGLGAGWR